MFFKKRKSRKQLLQEIEELKAEIVKLKNDKFKLDHIQMNIRTITASCIHNFRDFRSYDDIQNQDDIKNCLCQLLAKNLLPYVSFEQYVYAPVDPIFHGEAKYTGTIKILEDKE